MKTEYESLNMTGIIIRNWLHYTKDNKFSIGDYLIRRIKNYQYEKWNPEKFSSYCEDGVYRKYKVIKIDSLGVPYVAPIIWNGTLGKNAFPLCNADLRWERYELDPEYETYLLLDKENEYDPMARWKDQKRRRAKDLNNLC